MMHSKRLPAWSFFMIILALGIPAQAAQPVLETQAYPELSAMGPPVQALVGRNLLARKEVKSAPAVGASVDLLVDGEVGKLGAEGRVFLGGQQPAVLAFYLGALKSIHEVHVFSGNVDTRANQDYEVRFADNRAHPGQMPNFPAQPQLTSGDKVLGADRGGFHTRIADAQGAPLAQADWVQFRIWPTLGVQAGAPAKQLRGQGACVVLELAVLGAVNDVVLPSPEQLAYKKALREAPPAPEFIQRATWQETLIASREALLQWEGLQDRLALHNAPVTLGPWQVLGPLAPKSKDLAQLRAASAVDLSRRYQAEDGREIGWRTRAELADGQLQDLTGWDRGSRSAVYFLCRSVSVQQDLQREQLQLTMAADRGRATWLPDRHGVGVQNSLPLLRSQELRLTAGPRQLLLELQPSAEGRVRFWFGLQTAAHRPGAGNIHHRAALRRQLALRVQQQCADPVGALQFDWEEDDYLWYASRDKEVIDWLPGQAETYLQPRYREALQRRLQRLAALLDETTGVKAGALAPLRDRLRAWSEAQRKSLTAGLDTASLREKYYQTACVQELAILAGSLRSMQLAVEDQRQMFAERYAQAGAYLQRIAGLESQTAALWEPTLTGSPASLAALVQARTAIAAAKTSILLDTPLLGFDKLLVVKGRQGFAANWTGPNHLGEELVSLSPVRPDGKQTTLYKGAVSDMDLHWDGQRLLFSDGRTLREMNVDGSGLRQVSASDPPVTHYDGCYLPNGQIVCVSNACEQAVPCTGGADVGNLHILDADGRNERRVTFDQDHDWNPVVLNDGRVLYTRWEYVDLPHYFSRILFRMNPDGSGQMEYYGSSSYWPNAMYWPRPIPGHPTAVVCVVSGHHGVSRAGELLVLDPARGRFEADGVVQRIPGYQQKVEPVIQDQLVVNVWPRFAAPYPLAEPGTNRGAGKYFLTCVQQNEASSWDLCLVDVFDNITPILSGGYMTPIPVQKRPVPPVIPSNLHPQEKRGTIYLADIYRGDGLRGYPRGSIKALRVGTHHYRYAGNGDTRASSFEGGWDVKRILGTVPVHEDGSALFYVPANTPIFLQPLDAEGKTQQQMRSWYTAMPGETASCIGCHEQQNNGPPVKYTAAAQRKPDEIASWNGPVRGFSFDREVQPVLDRRCAGCHDGQPHAYGGQQVATLDLRAKQLRAEVKGEYSPAYMELQRYVRRAGYEADMHLLSPAEFEADTSVLVQMLKKGHYNVTLTRDEWERLYTWIDYNLPYPSNWRESHRPPRDEQVERRALHKKRFAGIDDHDEDPLPLPPVAKFEVPAPRAALPAAPVLENWPLSKEQAQKLQKESGPTDLELDLGAGVKMKLALIPAGRFVMGAAAGFADEAPTAVVSVAQPFFMGCLEVTNRQYAQYDARHDSGVIEGRGKDRTTRGTPVNQPDAPVVRVSWNEALRFCEWLSQRTGRRVTLPTEAQWEWACRAGASSAFHFGAHQPGMNNVANVADASIAAWNYGRGEPGYSDGAAYSVPGGRYAANAWGLFDMHGNVAEWCLSAYKPYPYRDDDGRNDPRTPELRVVRGGSWNDTLRYATSASRWRYQPYQPVYNVGFRVVCLGKAAPAVALGNRE